MRILTNSLGSSPDPIAHSGYMHYRELLLEDSVELYEVRSLPGNARGSGQTTAISRFDAMTQAENAYALELRHRARCREISRRYVETPRNGRQSRTALAHRPGHRARVNPAYHASRVVCRDPRSQLKLDFQ